MAGPKLRAFRSRVLYRALVLVTAIGRRIPLRIGQKLGAAIGTFAWHIVRRERKKALQNIAIAFPEWDDAKRRATIRAMFRHFGVSLFEIAWLWNMDLATRDRLTTFTGEGPMLKLIDEGKGVILFTAHVGNWEWLSIAMGLFSRPTSVLQRERGEGELNRYITEFRARVGVQSIDRGSPQSARQMIGAVRDGGILAFLLDQNMRTESVKVPFFGKPALTAIGPVKFAIRTEASVVIALQERKADGTHHITISDPIACKRGDDPVALAARITRAIEEHIRRVPEQWVWMHDRWRERAKWEVTS
ncbi:MAG TPA: lysophospholipid acyltransferase family protein [Thermoanaerobaculia bacterium]|nr:lysophospholipid acyltransferase family protein [Thermoanaerobaculia bacterium]